MKALSKNNDNHHFNHHKSDFYIEPIEIDTKANISPLARYIAQENDFSNDELSTINKSLNFLDEEHFEDKKNRNDEKEKIKGFFPSCISNTHCVPLSQSQATRQEHKFQLEDAFKGITRLSINTSNKFMRNKSWVNDTSWKMGKIERNLSNEWLDRYSKTLMVWKEIEQDSKDNGLIPIFFTGTIKGHLHPFASGSNNRKDDWIIDNLKLGYKELQNLHQDIRKQCSRTLGYSPLFIKAIEYHKSYMPHSHIVYFVEQNDVTKFLNIIENKIENNQNIGKTESVVLEAYDPQKAYSPVSYLLKYLKKTIVDLVEPKNKEQLEVFNGWKSTLGIKQLYNNSLYRIPKWAFKKLSYYFKDYDLDDTSILKLIEENCYIENNSFQLDGTQKTRVISSPKNPKYSLVRTIEKYQYLNEDDEILSADRVLEVIISDDKGRVLFKKSEFELLNDHDLPKYRSEISFPRDLLYNKIYIKSMKIANNEDYKEIRTFDNAYNSIFKAPS